MTNHVLCRKVSCEKRSSLSALAYGSSTAPSGPSTDSSDIVLCQRIEQSGRIPPPSSLLTDYAELTNRNSLVNPVYLARRRRFYRIVQSAAYYCDHLPLYRQSQIYARAGLELDRATMAEWVGLLAQLVEPLLEALGDYVMAPEKLHADDTPIPVLAPGTGKTKTGRLWTYVRDDRPSGSTDPPAVLFRYSPDRKGERPREHLQHFRGVLQADGYAGFQGLYDRQHEPLLEAACWAHARRKYFDLHASTASPLALEALERIAALYKIEEQCRGKSPTERRAARQEHAVPRLEKLREWLEATLRKTSKKSELAGAIRYTLSRWAALTRYCEDGRIEIDNSAAERTLRAVALGRKNYLFAGSDAGGERAAAFYSLIGSAKLNDMDPEAYLREVFTRIAEHPINRIEELLPWNLASGTAADVKSAA